MGSGKIAKYASRSHLSTISYTTNPKIKRNRHQLRSLSNSSENAAPTFRDLARKTKAPSLPLGFSLCSHFSRGGELRWWSKAKGINKGRERERERESRERESRERERERENGEDPKSPNGQRHGIGLLLGNYESEVEGAGEWDYESSHNFFFFFFSFPTVRFYRVRKRFWKII